MEESMGNVRVGIRVLPTSDDVLLLERSNAVEDGIAWSLNDASISLLKDGQATNTFTFDYVFGAKSQTLDIYNSLAKCIVDSALQGVNGTIFAYGQISSGKTHTMMGGGGGGTKSPGIIPLAISEIFAIIRQTPEREFLLRVSYLEIYNEKILDLLCPSSTKLKICKDLERGVFVKDAKEEVVMTSQEALLLMKIGEEHRHVGAADANVRSSRSHTIFKMVIESREKSETDGRDTKKLLDGAVKVSVLNFVDLAGSERLSHTLATGARMVEGCKINQSLSALGKVISKLAEGERGHVPYRNSKLTRILQPALGGNSRTAVICTIAPIFRDESLSTLKFADCAKQIRNSPIVNKAMDQPRAQPPAPLEVVRAPVLGNGEASEELRALQTVKQHLQQLEETNWRLENELQEEKARHAIFADLMTKQLDELSAQYCISEATSRQFQEQALHLEQTLGKENGEIKRLFSHNTGLEKQMETKENKRILQAEKQLTALTKAHEKLQLAEVQVALEQKEEAHHQLSADYGELERKSNDREEEIAQLQATIKKSSEDVTELLLTLEKCETTLRVKETYFAEALEEKEHLQMQVNAPEEADVAQTNDILLITKDAQAMTMSLNNLQCQLRASDREKNSLQQQPVGLNHRLSHTEQQLAGMKRERTVMDEHCAHLQREKSVKHKLADVTEELRASRKEKASVDEQLERMDVALENHLEFALRLESACLLTTQANKAVLDGGFAQREAAQLREAIVKVTELQTVFEANSKLRDESDDLFEELVSGYAWKTSSASYTPQRDENLAIAHAKVQGDTPFDAKKRRKARRMSSKKQPVLAAAPKGTPKRITAGGGDDDDDDNKENAHNHA